LRLVAAMAKQAARKMGTAGVDAAAAAAEAGAATAAATIDHDRVAQRAYELYLARGCEQGRELDDWLCAEREMQRATAGTPDPASDDR
jgi:hypothetical protein